MTDLLRRTPLGAAGVLALEAHRCLRISPGLPVAILRLVLLTLIIPAEALARRVILAIAGRLSVPPARRSAARPPSGPLPPRGATVTRPAAHRFRMLEPLPVLRQPNAEPKVRLQPAAPFVDAEARFARTLLNRTVALMQALRDTEAEAHRFLRRRRALAARARTPLAFGRPPGQDAAAADPILAAHLSAADDKAAAAWTPLCNTS